MNIFLIGFMGTGKTSNGYFLAYLLDRSFFDLDEEIEKRHGSIKIIFSEKGEQAFREIERDMLRRLAKRENAVIATGGGSPLFFDNLQVMKENGFTLFIDTPFEVILKRLKRNKLINDRPLLAGKKKEEILSLYNERLPIYRQADIVWRDDGSEKGLLYIIADYMNKRRG